MKRYILTIIFILCFCINSYALRIQRPRHFTYPLQESDISELNSTLEGLWLMQQGRYELDVVTVSKSSANTGEAWVLSSSGTYLLEIMVDGTVYSIPL